MGWFDDGLRLKLYISSAGDFVSLGTRTEYPFVSGGTGGAPQGWTPFIHPGRPAADVNLTTGLGRFSISNADAANPHTNFYYGASRSFLFKQNKRYIISVQCQFMDGKSTTVREIIQTPDGYGSGGIGTDATAISPWENAATWTGFVSSDSLTYVFLRAIGSPDKTDWGIQFQNFAITEQDQTYPEPVWNEVTCNIRSMNLRSGRDRSTSRYEVGSLSLTINNDDGDFSYRPFHPLGLRPGRFLKVEGNYPGYAPFPLYYGVIDGMTDSYSLDGHATVTMQCVDVSSLLSNTTVPGLTSEGTTMYSSARMVYLLDGTGWHPTKRDIRQGVYIQQNILANGRTVRDELGLIADSEGSFFYADRSGNLVYRGRDWADDRIVKVGAELLAQSHTFATGPKAIRFVFPRQKGNYIDTPSTVDLNVPGGAMRLIVRLSIADWSVVATEVIAAKYIPASSSRTWGLWRNGNRRFSFFAATYTKTTAADLPYANNETFWFRADVDFTTGIYRFFHAVDSPNEPSVWTQLGADQVGQPGIPNSASTVPLTFGAYSDGNSPLGGMIRRVILRTGITYLLAFDLSDINAPHAGMASFTSTSNHPMTVHQTDSYMIVQDVNTEVLPPVDTVPNFDSTIPIVCARGLETSWDRAAVVNEVSLANQGGTAIRQIDSDSQKKYGPRTFQRMDLLNDNSHAEYLTQRIADIMTGNTDATLRVNSVQFRPVDRPRTWPWTLSVWLNDLVRVRYINPRENWAFSVVAHIQGIEHAVSTVDWVTTLNLDNYVAFNFWDGSDQTGWDMSIWDQDLWDGYSYSDWSRGNKWSDSQSIWGP